MKLIVYGVTLVVVLLLCLLVWLRERARKRQEVQESQAALLGWRQEDGAIVGERIIHKDGTTVAFHTPVILKPGESIDLHFVVPAGCEPSGNKWRAYSINRKN